MSRSRFVELSHPIEDGMKTYPGLPEPHSEVLLDYDASREKYAGGVEFFIASLHLCGNTGRYVDSPLHRFRDGADLAALPLERLADLPIEVIDASKTSDRGIDTAQCRDAESRERRFYSTPAGPRTGERIGTSSRTLT